MFEKRCQLSDSPVRLHFNAFPHTKNKDCKHKQLKKQNELE